MNIATVSLNPMTNKFEASFEGQILARGNSSDYVLNVINGGFNSKAKKFNVTKAVLSEEVKLNFGQLPQTLGDDEIDVEPEFHINERFEFVEEFTEMVATGTLVSEMLVGRGGIGKSYTVTSTLKRLGLMKTYVEKEMVPGIDDDGNETEVEVEVVKGDYVVIKGYSTPKSLYRQLYENNGRLIIFDDCDSIFKNSDAVNVLKAALDSYDIREVSWNSENPFSDLPRSFIFTGKVIFISNMSMREMDTAIKTRCTCVDLSMSKSEMICRMYLIIASDEFMPEFSREVKEDALSFIEENVNRIAGLSLRSLIEVVKIRASAHPDKWKRMALYAVIHG
jgi:hypothetical protein